RPESPQSDPRIAAGWPVAEQKPEDEHTEDEGDTDQGGPDRIDGELCQRDAAAADGQGEQSGDCAIGELATEYPGQHDPESEDGGDSGDLCRTCEQAAPVQCGRRPGLGDEFGVSTGYASGDSSEQRKHAEHDGQCGDHCD